MEGRREEEGGVEWVSSVLASLGEAGYQVGASVVFTRRQNTTCSDDER